jgi:glycosyltransferase involved in cell wall biosynthesis
MFKKGLTIVVCCYNSAERLHQTLQHIAAQKCSGHIDWELIIVNNNSTDTTVSVAKAFAASHPSLQIKILDESKPGLSFARHCGFVNAAFEYVLLCDDDNWLDPYYLETAYNLMESNPEIGVLGGVGNAVADINIPDWFKRNENSYAVGKLFGNAGYVKYVYGAGMILRLPVYLNGLKKGFTSLLSDRKGKELSSGGDIELCYMFRLMGYKVFQSEQLKFDHFVDEGKLTDDYRQRINKGFAKTLLALRPYDLVISQRSESPGLLWLKEYCYLLKETLINVFKPKEDWNYLKSSLKVMLKYNREFRYNVKHIRSFASKQ